MNITMKPIGTMKSLFHFKNGTPRQASVCQNAPGILTVEKSVFNNPEHSLDGLQEYSHAWVIFVFHKNNNSHTKAKVKPPRLDGKRTGVFSSRSPYRPNNIGLSLVKIDKIEGATIYFSGVDMIDGTPVLDVKPYIPEYDCPVSNMYHSNKNEQSQLTDEVDGFQKKLPDERNHHALDNIICEKYNRTMDTPISTSSVTEVEKGLFAVSAALDKAGEVLVSQSLKEQNHDKQSINRSSDYTDSLCDNLLSAGEEVDEDLDMFLGGILSQAVQSLSSEIPLNNYVSTSDSDCAHANENDDKRSQSNQADDFPPHRSEPEINEPSIHQNQTSSGSDNTHTTEAESIPGEQDTSADFVSSAYPVVAPWLLKHAVQKLKVTFTTEALQQLQRFSKSSPDPLYRLQFLSNPEEAESAIRNVLREDPRSVYRRQHCQDSLYFFTVDIVHITCWFDEDIAQVVRLKPAATVPKLQGKLE